MIRRIGRNATSDHGGCHGARGFGCVFKRLRSVFQSESSFKWEHGYLVIYAAAHHWMGDSLRIARVWKTPDVMVNGDLEDTVPSSIPTNGV